MKFKGMNKFKVAPVKKNKRGMNKTEQRYESEILIPFRNDGKIIHYEFEPCKFRLGPGCFYDPDFMAVFADHIEFHEIKGNRILDPKGTVKFRSAAEKYPWFIWRLIMHKGKDGWKEFLIF